MVCINRGKLAPKGPKRHIQRVSREAFFRSPLSDKKSERRALSPGARLSADLAEFSYCANLATAALRHARHARLRRLRLPGRRREE